MLVNCQTRPQLQIFQSGDIFVPQKIPFSKTPNDVNACDLWFAPPPPPPPRLKILSAPMPDILSILNQKRKTRSDLTQRQTEVILQVLFDFFFATISAVISNNIMGFY